MKYKLKRVHVDSHYYSNVVTATFYLFFNFKAINFEVEDFPEYLPKDGEYSKEEISLLNLPKWVKSAISE